jgi:hypothetical protein
MRLSGDLQRRAVQGHRAHHDLASGEESEPVRGNVYRFRSDGIGGLAFLGGDAEVVHPEAGRGEVDRSESDRAPEGRLEPAVEEAGKKLLSEGLESQRAYGYSSRRGPAKDQQRPTPAQVELRKSPHRLLNERRGGFSTAAVFASAACSAVL